LSCAQLRVAAQNNHGFNSAFKPNGLLLSGICQTQLRFTLCSLKQILEEAPAPGLSPQYHSVLGDAAVKAALAAGYQNAGEPCGLHVCFLLGSPNIKKKTVQAVTLTKITKGKRNPVFYMVGT